MKKFVFFNITSDYFGNNMAHMIISKSVGPDGIAIEILSALDYFGVDKITEIINVIYDTGNILEDYSRIHLRGTVEVAKFK